MMANVPPSPKVSLNRGLSPTRADQTGVDPPPSPDYSVSATPPLPPQTARQTSQPLPPLLKGLPAPGSGRPSSVLGARPFGARRPAALEALIDRRFAFASDMLRSVGYVTTGAANYVVGGGPVQLDMRRAVEKEVEYRGALRLLDIGTGDGKFPHALNTAMPGVEAEGLSAMDFRINNRLFANRYAGFMFLGHEILAHGAGKRGVAVEDNPSLLTPQDLADLQTISLPKLPAAIAAAGGDWPTFACHMAHALHNEDPGAAARRAFEAQTLDPYAILHQVLPPSSDELPDARYHVGNAERLFDHPEIKPGQYDMVVSAVTMRHLTDPLAALAQMYDSLKVGGVLIVDEFDVPGLEGRLDDLHASLKAQGYDLYMGVNDSASATVKTFVMRKNDKPHLDFPVCYGEPPTNANAAVYAPTDLLRSTPSPEQTERMSAWHSALEGFGLIATNS